MGAKRRFRYDAVQEKMYEVFSDERHFDAPAIIDDVAPFVSPVDGTIIKSRSHLRDYMGERGLVPYEDAKTQRREEDRYEAGRRDRAMKEMLWEGVSKTYSMGNKPRR